MTTSDYEQCLKDCIKRNQQVIFKLSELLVEVESHHQRCNTIRTYGTTVSVAGVGLMIGSLLAAPFSDRLSTAVTFAAAGFSIGGAATNLIVGAVDRNKTREIIDQIHSLVRSRDPLMSKLKEQSDHFATIIKHLTSNGLSEEQAIRIALNGKKNRSSLQRRHSLSALVNGDVDLKTATLTHTFRPALVTLGRVLQVQFDVLKGVKFNSGAGSCDVLDQCALNATEETIGFSQLMATAAVITSVVISAIDLAFLIRNWTSAHPTVNVITDVRHQLETETKSLEEILSTIEQIRRRPVPTPSTNDKATMTTEDAPKDVQSPQKSDPATLLIKQMLSKPRRPIKSMSFDEKTRHEPVINNDVLSVQRDIIDSFLQQRFTKTFDQLRKIPPSSSIHRAYHHPFATEVQYNIQTRMVARLTNDSNAPKIVDLLYNVLINLIRNSARDQMLYLYDNGTLLGSTSTSTLHAAGVQMSRMHVFVDDAALNHWLRVQGGDKRAYESAQQEVYRMFVNLDEQTRLWVNELKSFGY